ncbi:MAG: type I polyketide synthase [Phormidesmis sp.]
MTVYLELPPPLQHEDLTVVDLLRHRAQHQAEQEAYLFWEDKKIVSNSLSYGSLDQRARVIAASLQSITQPGERVLLLYPSDLDFVAAFYGCLYAGVTAVPAYPPKRNQKMYRLQAIATDAQTTVALTTQALLKTLGQQFSTEPTLASLRVLATDSIPSEEASWQPLSLHGQSLAFLQYTSGSTGAPKGVMVSHSNLLHNSATIHQKFDHSADSRGVIWLPPYHDMGLIGGVLQPLYGGFPVLLMSPVAFLQKPLRWLQAISDYGATTSGGPNFAYDLCLKKIKPDQLDNIDLSTWKVAFTGAEPIRSETLAQFAATFEPLGFRSEAFYPCYGMAETTLLVTGGLSAEPPIVRAIEGSALEQNQVVFGGDRAESSDLREIVSCGKSPSDQTIAVVHPESLARCADDTVGEIWVSGPSVAQGYWHQPEQTREIFQAYLSETGEGPFLRTGDLGFLHEGELFVTGRLKDMIIIRGQNHYPQDIELTVEQADPALRTGCGVAFSVEIDNREKLVIAQEVERSYLRKLDSNAVITAIRRAISDQHNLQTYAVLLLKTASLPKTSSGKVRRTACRDKFLSGSLDVVADWSVNPSKTTEFRDLESQIGSLLEQVKTGQVSSVPTKPALSQSNIDSPPPPLTAAVIADWLISKVAEQLEIHPTEIDSHQPLANYGLDSVVAINLSGELASWLGYSLSPTLLYDYPTIASLAQQLASAPAAVPLPVEAQVRSGAELPAETVEIAIIGLGCRFPGADSPEAFWQLLQTGVDAIQTVPASRWDTDHFYESTPASPGKMNTCWGGFLDQVDQFDPQFFGISAREAKQMDPQQRLLLEVSWEALEKAGQAPDQLAGSDTGVFMGISHSDYAQLQFNQLPQLSAYSGTGNALSIAANRLSYLLDFRGPSWSVDTACSSSLVAVHQACHSLRQGDCSMALAGGVNLVLTPQMTVTFSQARMMAPDGRCKTFDAEADGYVRGEGCGVVVLKRVDDAHRDGDPILAVIRGSAVNQDGRSNGLTAPNGPAQQAVIRQALENARVTPDQIGYVEAHGTGTSLGDPIEMNALKSVLVPGRSPEQRCWIGSVKTNLGHLEAAAGIAGLIKGVLSLQHEAIPAHLHFKQLNPYIELARTPLAIPTKEQPWPRTETARLAGISSFGFGGTNAHVVLAEAPAQSAASPTVERPQHCFTLSARSEPALRMLAERYETYLAAHPNSSLANVCFTANVGRSHFEHRLCSWVDTSEQLREQLQRVAKGQRSNRFIVGEVTQKSSPKIAFLFTGQGSQYIDMGRQLYETQPTFRNILQDCDQKLRPYLQHSLIDLLYPAMPGKAIDPMALEATAYTQPALFVLEYAIAQLLQSWGVVPDMVLGHSVGEYAAACVAGVFSLEDGLKLIAQRGRLMQDLPAGGKMAVVWAEPFQVEAILQADGLAVAIAAINGPNNTVISGSAEAVEAAVASLQTARMETQALAVSHAFHSPLMEPMVAAFARVAAEVSYHSPKIGFISSATGQATDDIATPDYWCQQIIQPVRFSAALRTLAEREPEAFIEIGPKPTLLSMGRQCLAAQAGLWLPTLSPQKADWSQLLKSLASLYTCGVTVDWRSFDQDYVRRRLPLPTYPFQRQRYWIDEAGTFSPDHTVSDPAASTIMTLIDKGDSAQLAAHLSQVSHFSDAQRALLPALSTLLVQQHRQQVKATAVEDWFYQLTWQTCDQTPVAPLGSAQSGHWLILADARGIGETLAQRLRAQGYTCTLVFPGETYTANADGTWVLNPACQEDFMRLFAAADLTAGVPLRGILHLWSLDAADPARLSPEALSQAQRQGCGSLLPLVQAVISAAVTSPRLWLMTQAAMPVTEPATDATPLAVAQTPLWGFGKVLSLEHPDLWGGLIDLPAVVCEEDIQRLIEEISSSADSPLSKEKLREDQLAFRQGQRYVARLTRRPLPASPPLSLNPEATYLITGGLGSLGLQVAQWMVAQGARCLVLLGRRGETAEARAAIAPMRQAGAQVEVIQADVASPTEMTYLFEHRLATLPPLKGVIHAAGVSSLNSITDMTLAQLETVLRPKLLGTWILHQLTQTLSLDFLVGFSSIAAVWGSSGQAHYAAANQFIDGLAHYRQAQGLPALSINWGLWATGMATSEDQKHLSRMGIHPLQPDQGVTALAKLLGALQDQTTGSATLTQTTVANVDWSLFKAMYNARGYRALLAAIDQADSPDEPYPVDAPPAQSDLLQQLIALPLEDRFEQLIAYLQSEVAAVLGLDSEQLPALHQGFFDMGMDSLMAVELKTRLEESLGCTLPATLAIESPNILSLSCAIWEQWLPPNVSNPGVSPQDERLQKNGHRTMGLEQTALIQVQQLPDDKLESLINDELAALLQ